jgi:glycerol-3-phosphate dehydrogenase
MIRRVERLSSGTFDVLVVGGGIYGLMTAYDAATRGLSVALIERDDFGSGASFNHLRTIHGGLRYLQTLDVGRARESVRERRAFARIAPLAVRPLQFVLPLSSSLVRGKLAMRVGFALDRLVASDRNEDVLASHRLPPGAVLSRSDALARFPVLQSDDLSGAAVWYDYVLVEADRLTFTVALAADAAGAVIANHVEALSLLTDGRRVVGARARDVRSGRSLEIAARVTVNATGAAVDRLPATLPVSGGLRLLTAMNLVTRRPPIAGDAVAVGGRTRTGRHLFTVPWRGRALFGTWEAAGCAAGEAGGSEAGVHAAKEALAFIDALNQSFPSLTLTPDDVTLIHRGMVPARVDANGNVTLEGREQVRTYESDGVSGLISVAGTKYTTARAVAERVVNVAFRKLERAPSHCRTAIRPLLSVPESAAETGAVLAARSVEDDLQAHLLAAYGLRFDAVLSLCDERPEFGARLSDASPVIAAELVWAVRHEMALTLADAILRRTPIGALGDPGDATLHRAADIVGAELNWSDVERERQIDEVRRFYRLRAV